jgi:hypothetical protein
MQTKIIGHGLYTFSEAALLAHLRRGRVKEWFIGRTSEFKFRRF